MGVYYKSGVVFGYKVKIKQLERRWEDDPVWDAAKHFGVEYVWAGNFYADTGPDEVVFHSKGKANHIQCQSSLHNTSEEFGFKSADHLDTTVDDNLNRMMDEVDGELGFYAYFTVD